MVEGDGGVDEIMDETGEEARILKKGVCKKAMERVSNLPGRPESYAMPSISAVSYLIIVSFIVYMVSYIICLHVLVLYMMAYGSTNQ